MRSKRFNWYDHKIKELEKELARMRVGRKEKGMVIRAVDEEKVGRAESHHIIQYGEAVRIK